MVVVVTCGLLVSSLLTDEIESFKGGEEVASDVSPDSWSDSRSSLNLQAPGEVTREDIMVGEARLIV